MTYLSELFHCVPCLAHTVLALACMWCTLCRLNQMRRGTPHVLFIEYFCIGIISTVLLMIRSQVWVFVALTVILIHFFVTSKYWKQHYPLKY